MLQVSQNAGQQSKLSTFKKKTMVSSGKWKAWLHSVCGNVRNINVLSSQGIRLSMEWREGKVGAFGITRAQQQAALRKKIMEHRLSQAHKKAAALTAVAQDNAIQNAVAAQLSEHYEAT